MARQHTRINPLAFGIMGAIVGGLQLRISLEHERLLEEADTVKRERLAALQYGMQLDAEARDDARWETRNAIEFDQRMQTQQFENEAMQGRQRTAQEFQAEQASRQRQHEIGMEGIRTENDLRQIEAQGDVTAANQQRAARIDRTNRVYDKVYDATFDRAFGTEQNGGAGKAILGDDGRTYPYGTPLPAGVKPAGGYGISWAPSASKGGVGDGSNYVSPRAGRPAVPGPASAPGGVPSGYTHVGYKDGKRIFRDPQGGLHIEE